jgi:uncharacterized protein
MLIDRIDADLKHALKNKDVARVSTLRFLKSALQNLSIEKRKPLEEEDIISVIKKQVKQRKDSIESFKSGNRLDLVEKEEHELAILKNYIPEEIDNSNLVCIIKDAISHAGASSQADLGSVMKIVMAAVKGRADGNRVSSLVKEELLKMRKG